MRKANCARRVSWLQRESPGVAKAPDGSAPEREAVSAVTIRERRQANAIRRRVHAAAVRAAYTHLSTIYPTEAAARAAYRASYRHCAACQLGLSADASQVDEVVAESATT